MALLLALESSTPLGSVALARDGRLLCEISTGVSVRQSESLLPALDFAFATTGEERSALEGIVVGAGPGSFTGVRIAGATAKGLARALGLPFLAFSSLAALAASVGAGARPVCALFDARREQVYAACYRFPQYADIEVVAQPRVAAIEAVLDDVPAEALFVGEGAHRYRASIEARGGEVAPQHLGVPRAAALLWLAGLDPDAAKVDSPGAWEPLYLRGAGAERGVRG